MHTHGSLNSYGDLDKSKSIPKTGNGKNTEWRCTTCNLTKMQKIVWERSTYCWGSSLWKRLPCGPWEVEKPLKEKREILLCFMVVIGVLEQKLNIDLTRVLFVCLRIFCDFPLLLKKDLIWNASFNLRSAALPLSLSLHSLCLELLLLSLISVISRSLWILPKSEETAPDSLPQSVTPISMFISFLALSTICNDPDLSLLFSTDCLAPAGL